MNPKPFDDELAPDEAARRLRQICDVLEEVHQVPAGALAEVRELSERFSRQLHNLPAYQDRVIEFVRRCWL